MTHPPRTPPIAEEIPGYRPKGLPSLSPTHGRQSETSLDVIPGQVEPFSGVVRGVRSADVAVRIITGDCRAAMASEGPFDLIIADPPYGDTRLAWDQKVRGWEAVALARLKPTGSLWIFGSMRYFMAEGAPAGARLAQDVVWEKPNGSGFAADRFKRVHEHACQFYRADAPWEGVFNEVQRVAYVGSSKSILRRNSHRGDHVGAIANQPYVDDGTRIVRSIIPAPQVRGGLHKTQKPVELLALLIRTSCPPGGLVGDFFAGSGAAGEACALTGRNYVGCEIDAAMAAKASARLAQNLFCGKAA